MVNFGTKTLFLAAVLIGFALGQLVGVVDRFRERREMVDTSARIEKELDQARRQVNEVKNQCIERESQWQDFIRSYGERAK